MPGPQWKDMQVVKFTWRDSQNIAVQRQIMFAVYIYKSNQNKTKPAPCN